MTNTEILEKAMRNAITGGWKDSFDKVVHVSTEYNYYKSAYKVSIWGVYNDGPVEEREYRLYSDYKEFIFSHDFAKALWGDAEIETGNAYYDPNSGVEGSGAYRSVKVRAWQYHLQQMVVAEHPIKYLGEHLND